MQDLVPCWWVALIECCCVCAVGRVDNALKIAVKVLETDQIDSRSLQLLLVVCTPLARHTPSCTHLTQTNDNTIAQHLLVTISICALAHAHSCTAHVCTHTNANIYAHLYTLRYSRAFTQPHIHTNRVYTQTWTQNTFTETQMQCSHRHSGHMDTGTGTGTGTDTDTDRQAQKKAERHNSVRICAHM